MASGDQGRSLPGTLNAWTTFLTDNELPAFARTVSDVTRISNDPEASVGNLSAAIQKDAAMAARLVKLANSPLFPSGHGRVQTVERGVVLLGFDAVRDLAISLSVIENVLRGDSRESLLVEMALAFHTATQAKNLADICRDEEVSEIFVAGLLYRIGLLAILSTSDPRLARYIAEKDALGDDRADVMRLERRLFGCDMTQLSRRLAQHWSLGPVLQQALSPNASVARDRIVMARRIAELSSLRGWESQEVHEFLSRCARNLELEPRRFEEKILQGSEAAREMAVKFGVSKAVPLIPETAKAKARREDDPGGLDVISQPAFDSVAASVPGRSILSPDPAVQLDMLGRMSAQLAGKPDLNLLLQTVIEGVHRGVGMDRTLFALLTANRDGVGVKYCLSESDENLRADFRFSLQPHSNPLLAAVVRQQKAFWMCQQAAPEERALLQGPFAQFVGEADFLIYPAIYGKRCIGFIYADRARSGRAIAQDDCNSFRRFAQQLSVGLRLISAA